MLTVVFNYPSCIREIKIPRYQDSGRCIGYAHLTLKTEEARDQALALTGVKLKGRYLDIKEAEGKNNAQFSKDHTSKPNERLSHNFSE